MPYTSCTLAIIEDEAFLRNDLVDFFTLKGARAQGFASAESFYTHFTHFSFDLVILDIGLPGDSGVEVTRKLRLQSDVPILVLTSSSDNHTHLESLNAGADLFLSKSRSMDVIDSSVRNILLRLQQTTATQLFESDNTWQLSVGYTYITAPNQRRCQVTPLEALMLNILMQQQGKTLSREFIIKTLDKPSTLSSLRSLDTYINRIRGKCLKATALEIPIQAVYALGYIFSGKSKLLDYQVN